MKAAKRTLLPNSFGAFVLFLAFCAGAANGIAENNNSYTYYYQGDAITLTPSLSLIAIKDGSDKAKVLESQAGLVRDGLSEQNALAATGYVVYRNKPEGKGIKKDAEPPAFGKWTALQEKAALLDVEIQPVFEQGGAVLIPFDEVIVGFEEAIDLEQAIAFFEPYQSELGIVEVRAHRPNTFIVRIENASNGRCYTVSQSLNEVAGIQFAEPNHIVLRSNPAPRTIPEISRGGAAIKWSSCPRIPHLQYRKPRLNLRVMKRPLIPT